MADYEHPRDVNLSGINKGMEYNAVGLPALRVIGNNFGWGIQVADGDIEGVSHIEKFGMNLDVDTDKETIWDGGGIYSYQPVGVPTNVIVTSTSLDDAPAGTGARTISLQGLDANYEPATEVILMGGTSTTLFIRIFRAVVLTSGSSTNNAGVISFNCVGTSNLLAQIGIDGLGPTASGRGQTFMALYTIPAGKTGYITQWTVGAGKFSGDAVAFLMTRNPDAVGDGAWNARDVITVSATTYSKNYNVPIKLNAGDDVEVRAFSTTNNSIVTSTFNIILIDNAVAT